MKRPPKPRIAKQNLVWRWKGDKRGWQPYYRLSTTEGGKEKRVETLLKWDGDSELLDDLYWLVRSGRAVVRPETEPEPAVQTWQELIAAYRGSRRGYLKVKPGTQKKYDWAMKVIEAGSGKNPVADTTPHDLIEIHEQMADTPRQADRILQMVSSLWNWACRPPLSWDLGRNPASGIEHYGPQKQFLPWPAWLVDELASAPLSVRVSCNLIRCTGQRPSAAIAMRWDQFRDDEMEVVDEKTATPFWVFCPPELRDFLKTVPREGDHILPRSEDEAAGYDRIERAFRTWREGVERKEDALRYSMHGLRKLAIIQLAEAGATDAQIQAITNQSLQTIEYYRSLADRKTLSRSAFEARKLKIV